MRALGSISNCIPLLAKGPTTGSQRNWCQRVSVFRSHISLLLGYRNPDVPNSSCLAVDLSGIHDSRTAEGSIGRGDGDTCDHIVGHLMGVQNAQRIGAVLSVDRDFKHSIVGTEVIILFGR